VDATSANTVSKVVARDASGNFSAGTITASLNGNATTSSSTSGNAATATALQTARTIGGVSFNGTANIDLPGVNTAGNQNTTGNAATATSAATWTTARTLTVGATGKSVNGSANVSWTVAEVVGFTPVQQGGGTGQGVNKIYIGWLGTLLGLQVDSTNFGSTWPIAITGNSATATTATNLAGGSAGTVPYQSAAGTTVQLAAGTAGRMLMSNGAAAPSWATVNGGTF
jgi:hypothetical protein